MRNNGAVTSAERDTDATDTTDEPGQPRRLGLLLAVAGVAFGLDLVSKVLVVANLDGGHPPVKVLFGAVYLVETRNSGAAFSMGTGATAILTVIALGIVAVILRTARKMHSTGWAVALGLILGGALGNLADRIFRSPGIARGHVVDWISAFSDDGHVWPIFNLADSAIVCGAVLTAVLAIRGIDIEGRDQRDGRE